ncbi:MAG: aldo/keto reductase [Gammaproteobacteria bacterium]|nr:aldo/keto reductase [Gammaproteobacteria bacterium]MDH3429918.1 aldo/keto reductase [Gammaproteobacteria bacterium]
MPDFHEISRRRFLAQSAALAAAASLPLASCAEESMRTRRIPGTDEALPVVGLGAPLPFVELPPEGRDLPKALIQTMVDMGGRLIDTPAFFRPDVPVIGELLTEMGLQQELFLTGKITVNGKEEGIAHLEKTVANLNKRPMDLLMVHNMREMDLHWPTLKEWQAAGRVRYIGVSLARTTDYSQLEGFMKAERPDFIMVRYSIHHPHSGERILPLAEDSGIAVIGVEAFKTNDDGGFFGLVAGKQLPQWAAEFDCESWAQFSLKYMLSNPALTCVVTETSKVKHVVDNMRAGYGRLPDMATRQRMREHVLSL